MKDRPYISIIVPVYNVEEYLRECLDSILCQTLEDLQILCVNDGSSDGSLGILREYEKKDSRIEIIDQPNAGVSAARNTGLKQARGRYTLFVDSDDTIDRTLCERAGEKATVTGADMTFFYFQRAENAGPSSIFRSLPTEEMVSPDQKIAVARFGFPWLKLYRTDLLTKNDIVFPEGLRYEDILFHWQSFVLAGKIAVLPEPLYIYRERAGSMLAGRGEYFCDIVPIFERIKRFLIQHGVYEDYKNEFLRFKLTMFQDAYHGIRGPYKPRLVGLIKDSCGEEERLYRREKGNELKGKVRDFFASLDGEKTARIRYALRATAYTIERFVVRLMRNRLKEKN